ncbi:helix-turn-helix transcriptional regulator [Tissierella carlieri]|uniref:helix-turn-helix domain-containing protein n=1 Tax=Tissierella carlieri TaxID=689904 RepID=UPI001C123FC6|nr:helix-turn-helix transcriptional regulator [Tissierella carlieri]MBU5311867.1 helix-turn-helix transcriptional regulator [Tissierella carlieri]
MDLIKLGKTLQNKRDELKLSLRDAGELIGISHNYLSILEKAKDPRSDAPIKPTIDTLKLISDAYKIDINILLPLAGYEDILIRPNDNTNINTSNQEDVDNKNIKLNDKEEQDIVPEEFTNPDEARAYVNKHQIFGSGGFDADKLDDNEILEFANALLEQMKMVSYKYKKN